MGFGVDGNLTKIYDNYVKSHPECSILSPDAIWLRMKEDGEITQEQYNAIKKGLIFDLNSKKTDDNWKTILGLETTPQTKKTNYVEQKQTHKYVKELELDYKGKIDLKQFDLKSLKEKYDSKLYDIKFEKNNWGIEIIRIISKKNNNNVLEITKDTNGTIYYSNKSKNSLVNCILNGKGDLIQSIIGKDENNNIFRNYSNGKITNESIKKDGNTTESKFFNDGKLVWHAIYGKPEGDYRLDYKDGKITQKYMLSGPDEDVYYIYENGKPIKKMFATTKQQYAQEGDTDWIVEDYRRTGKINKIVQELHDDIYAKNKFGLPTTRASLSKHVMNIKPDEVEEVIKKYEELNGENLLDAIENEIGMDFEEKTKIHNHLEKLYIDNGSRWDTGSYIGERLTKYKGIAAITGKEFARYVKLINPSNVIGVLRNFEEPEGFDKGIIKFVELLGAHVDVSGYNFLVPYTGLLQNIMIKGGLNDNQKKELVEHVLTQLEKCADENSDFIYVKDIVKSTRKNMKEGNSLRKDSLRLQIRAIHSYMGGEKGTNKANGKFDADFMQGSTGDCWLVAGLMSVIKKPAGKKALESMIEVDANGNVTVNMKGVGKTYKISAKEIEESVHLSTGDGDIRAIEIAMDRYIQETSYWRTSIDGNRTKIFYNAFFGNGHSFSYDEDFNNPNKFHSLAVTRDFNAINKDGEEVKVSGTHEIAIIGSDEDYVHVLDPNKGTAEPLRIPWSKFRLMYAQFNNMDVCELPK